jgi:hypothetical protein
MVSSALRFVFSLLLLWVGGRTILIGINDGMIRRRISSRLHRNGRALTGTFAVWYGASTALVGAAVAIFALWFAKSAMIQSVPR